AFLADARAERVQLHRPLGLAEPELHSPAGEKIERRHALGHADRMVRGELHDAVAEPDALRALARGAEKDFRRRAVGVLLEKVMLDAPRVVEAELVGELDLCESVLEELVLATFRPRAGQLELVEDPEFHDAAAYRKCDGPRRLLGATDLAYALDRHREHSDSSPPAPAVRRRDGPARRRAACRIRGPTGRAAL